MQTCNENTRISAALSRLTATRSPSTRHNLPKTSLCSKSLENVLQLFLTLSKALWLTAASVGESEEGQGALRNIEFLSWVCSACDQACIPIRSESRCLCGHRLKEHAQTNSSGAGRCNHARCACKSFFFIPAEGSWILRCRCKHRHTDHSPVSHACCKASCTCDMFQSPWVCNCGHAWSQHQQVLVKKNVPSAAYMMAAATPDATVLAELASPTDANQLSLQLVSRGDTA